MLRPDPVTGLRRRLVLLHVPAVALAAMLLHMNLWPVNGLTLVATAALASALVLLLFDVENTGHATAQAASEAAL